MNLKSSSQQNSFKPRYRILVTSKYFPEDVAICLGTQLIWIIKSIENCLPPHMWYGADVEAVGIGAQEYGLNNFQLSKIGTDLQFIEYCSEIEQFIWGVFLCIDENFLSQSIQGIELGTEDEPYRSIELEGVLIEIRAFDTSFFELFSENAILMDALSKKYNAPVLLESNSEKEQNSDA